MGIRNTTATPHQRTEIKRLLLAGGYDRGTVSRKYLRLGVGSQWIGIGTESWLDALSFPEAESYLWQLTKDAAHGSTAGARA